MSQIDIGGKRLDLSLLATELTAAGVPHNALGTLGTLLITYDTAGMIVDDWPPEAGPVVAAHNPPLQAIEVAGSVAVDAVARTTDATALEVFRFPCEPQHLYEANLIIRGIDAGNFAVKRMVGEFVWKRLSGNAIVTGLTVVSDIHDTAAASWAPNFHVEATEIVFTVQGAAGRTIDWFLDGSVGTYAPAGLATA